VFIPLGDDNSRRVLVPYVNVTLIVLNVFAFLVELAAQAQGTLPAFLNHWSVIAADYTRGAGLGGPVPWTLLTSMFLHGGWAHLIGNMVYLAIFGDNVESALGHVRYLLFYLVAGVAGALTQIAGGPGSVVPTLGASAAISGVLAAYVFYFPRNRVLVWFVFQVSAVPALLVIGLWALLQLVSGFGSLSAGPTMGGVAYLAHVGGFACGLLGAALFRSTARLGPDLPA
jgi:membrane associated rhomboid family serine protease